MFPIICSKVKNRGGLPGSFKQTPNDPMRGVVVGFDPYVNSISMSENRPMITPYSFEMRPGALHRIGPGAGIVGLFLVGQWLTPLFSLIDPTLNWGCYRKNRKFVDWSFFGSLMNCNCNDAVLHLRQTACVPRPSACPACPRAWENLNTREFCPNSSICSGFAMIGRFNDSPN